MPPGKLFLQKIPGKMFVKKMSGRLTLYADKPTEQCAYQILQETICTVSVILLTASAQLEAVELYNIY